jgi:NADPH:quinone reductase
VQINSEIQYLFSSPGRKALLEGLEALSYLATTIGLGGLAFGVYCYLRDADWQVYSQLNKRSEDLRRLIIENVDLGTAWPLHEVKGLSKQQIIQRSIIFDSVTHLFEEVFKAYQRSSTKLRREQYEGWQEAMLEYAFKPSYREWWRKGDFGRLGNQLDPEFQRLIRSIIARAEKIYGLFERLEAGEWIDDPECEKTGYLKSEIMQWFKVLTVSSQPKYANTRMTHAIHVHHYGGPEALEWDEVEVPAPGPGEIAIRQTAIGLNFIDVYQRKGLYPQAGFPFIPGSEGAGVVTALGQGVSGLQVGDRVAYAGPLGAYAEARLLPADRAVKLPGGISDEIAAASMLKGMTAEYLLRQTYHVGPGTVMLYHAAAGGVGLIACQWAAALGATVIGTAGSAEKAALAKAHGCAQVINYRTENFVEAVKAYTNDKGVDVVYDSVGKDTFPGSLDCLRPRGLWVSFGNASGPVPEFSILLLSQKGSLYATRPSLFHYIATREALAASANGLFEAISSGKVRIAVDQRYPLKDAGLAHRDLEARRTTGSTVLLP